MAGHRQMTNDELVTFALKVISDYLDIDGPATAAQLQKLAFTVTKAVEATIQIADL